MKKMIIGFLVCSFLVITCSVNAPAISRPAGDSLFEEVLMSMYPDFENTAQPEGLAPINRATGGLIAALLMTGRDGNPEPLRTAVEHYTEAVDLIREQQLVEECRDDLLSGLLYTGWSLLQTVSGGGDPVCLTLSAGSIIADILLVLQSYQLCVIDTSEVPDESLRETICGQQRLVKTYDFIVGWVYATQCLYGASWATYLTLIVNFLTVFPVCS